MTEYTYLDLPDDLLPFVAKRQTFHDGYQTVLNFPNGYGASVVQHRYSYGGNDGLYELAVVTVDDNGDVVGLNYDTPVTDDVLGRLTSEEAVAAIREIQNLPAQQSEVTT